MNDQLRGFMEDLVVLLREKYNQSHDDSHGDKDESDKLFWKGATYAYYDVLDLLDSQLKLFGCELTKPIVPELGKKC